jgi:hypothetical protein
LPETGSVIEGIKKIEMGIFGEADLPKLKTLQIQGEDLDHSKSYPKLR